MNLILVVGHTGQGKSTLVRKMIEGKAAYVFDVNNEYPMLPKDYKVNFRFRHVEMNLKKFVSVCERLKSYNIVFEDSTGFLRGKQSAHFMRLIIAKRHSGNNYFLIFHSLNRVPPELLELCNVLFLFKTNDYEDIVRRKFDDNRIVDAMLTVQAAKKYSFAKISFT